MLHHTTENQLSLSLWFSPRLLYWESCRIDSVALKTAPLGLLFSVVELAPTKMDELKQYRKRPGNEVLAVCLDLKTDGFTYSKWGGEQRYEAGD